MIPSRRRTEGSRGLLLPNQLIRPVVGMAAVASSRRRVVLPEPLGPISPRTSPADSFRLTSKTPLPPRKVRVSPLARRGSASETVAALMEIARGDPFLNGEVHHFAGDASLPEFTSVSLDSLHHLPLDEVRHVTEPGLRIEVPLQQRPLALQRLGDLVPHLELEIHDLGRDHRSQPFPGGRPLHPPAAQFPAIRWKLVQACLGLGRPAEAMLE